MASRALGTFFRPQDPLVLAKRFAPKFGIKNPKQELIEVKKNEMDVGHGSVRHQQKYEDIPVLAGELIVNTNVDAAQRYAMRTLELYASKHVPDSLDNAGMTIIPTVHYSSSYGNSFCGGVCY